VVVVGGGIGYMAEVVVEVGDEFGCMAKVVVEDWCWVGCACGRADVPASALAGEVCQRCTVAL
jgi:uncharacterized membrane protein YeaQ/YmgE (transglycosylase-associated protein family)